MTTFFSNEEEDDEEEGKDETDAAKQLKASIFLNIAACDIKLGELREAIEFCDKALEIEPQNQKALYRKGKALALLQEWDESKKIFQSLLQSDPENNDVKRELVLKSLTCFEMFIFLKAKLKKAKNEYLEKEKKFYSTAFKVIL